MIQRALTPDEWAIVVSEPGYVIIRPDHIEIRNFKFSGNGQPMPVDPEIMASARLAALEWAANGILSELYEHGGIDAMEAVAGACLRGRITWEMVDAIRGDIYEMGKPPYTEGEAAHIANHAALADLLESLLPPRAP